MATIPTQNPVPSEKPKDLKFNSGKIDEFVTSMGWTYTDRFGVKHYTIDGIKHIAEQAISAFGYITIDSFENGANITLPNQVLRWKSNGEYYRWDGLFPKTVPVGSTPESTGGVGAKAWVSVGYAALSSQIISATGSTGIDSALHDIATASYAIRNRRHLGVTNNKLREGSALSIICVGDSITYGYDVTSSDVLAPPEGHVVTRAPVQYPSRLQERLLLLTKSNVTVINRGFSGDTAKRSFDRWTDNPQGDVAHIMLGINDAGGRYSATFEEYAEYMEKLIRRYIDWGHGVVLHTSSAQSFNNLNYGGARFTQYARSLADSYGCPVFESEGVHQYCRYREVYSDSTHFNKAGYAKYGDAVAAFILAGCWVRPVRPISACTTQQAGRATEGIGWFGTQNTTLTTTETGSFVWSGATAGILANTNGIHSFSFFLDAEAANIYFVSRLNGATVSLSDPLTTVDGFEAVNKAPPKFSRHAITETKSYQVSTRLAGYKSWIGSLVGRGWKTVYVKNDVSNNVAVYVNQIVIEPCNPENVTQNIGTSVQGTKEILVYNLPVIDVSHPLNVLPPVEKMPSKVYFPLPKGLHRSRQQWSHWFDNLALDLRIKTVYSDGGAAYNGIHKLVAYTFSVAYGAGMIVESVYKSKENCIMPTKIEFGWEDANDETHQIHENSYPSGEGKIMYLILSFPDHPAAYYSIDIECNTLMNSYGSWM
ncbi:GDSL-type esterase/lipase family protein [Yersinia intermedia]|uniref:GDSL-type esterase/lipase family protein n=2 Tax=Yersinia intermedia TaxID=631 RepID=UPI00224429A6|nr:GDSL-type esterase/lipase family protein [Yersinia intermedia]MCW8110179.1 GDSL-type esterase/lipase family protein [Yersinia intermedia]MDA5515102.1 GDSL-type esterase/lipase family protein [Yersinia intermedia]